MKRPLLALAVVAVAIGCATVDTSKLPRMGVDFAFDQKHKCGGVSPEIRLSNVPAGVVSYDVTMIDLDYQTFRHWGQTLVATGPVIREGAGAGYFGPCPPFGTSHRYEIRVLARDSQEQAVAYGEKMVVAGR